MYRFLIVLLLLLIAWGLWSVFNISSVWTNERKVEPEPFPQVAPTPEPPPSEPPPPEEPAPVTEPPPLTEARKLELLDQKVRECISRQQGVALPMGLEQMTDISGHEYGPVSVIRLEPDGVHIRHAGGVTKIGFAWLTEELKERFFLEDELAARYRAVNAERRRTGEQARLRKQKDVAVAVGPMATASQDDAGSVHREKGRCNVCGKRVPASQIKTFWSRVPGTTSMGNVQFCRQCAPSSNGVDPYMQR